MSNKRQKSLRSLSARFSPGQRIDWHTHGWSQLIYASEGVMTVSLAEGKWVVPTRHAINVGKGERHRIDMHGRVSLRTVYFQRTMNHLQKETVFKIHPLMHELILYVCELGITRPDSLSNRTLIRFFEQQVNLLVALDSMLKMPNDGRALRFANFLLANPATDRSLSSIAKECGTSLRTLQRLFPAEVGCSVSKWQHRVRMFRAVEHLGQGKAVTSVAFEVGFESVSAFINSFNDTLGSHQEITDQNDDEKRGRWDRFHFEINASKPTPANFQSSKFHQAFESVK